MSKPKKHRKIKPVAKIKPSQVAEDHVVLPPIPLTLWQTICKAMGW